MKVLLSIKPIFANEIFNGNKKFEYRKSIFKNKDIKTIVVYSTKPIGKIIGEFDIEDIIEDSPSEIWRLTKKYSGIEKHLYIDYFLNRAKGYAIKIGKIKKYESPINPYVDYDNFTAPQSFKYIKESFR